MPFMTGGTPNIKDLEDEVKELQELLKKRKWWEQTWVQAIALTSAITGIIAVLVTFLNKTP